MEPKIAILKFYQYLFQELIENRKNTAYNSHPEDYIEGQKQFFAENPDANNPTKLMLMELKPVLMNAIVADIGCGSAQNLDFYLTSGARQVKFIDPAKRILEIGQEKITAVGMPSEKVSFQIGDFENNTLEDESIDVIVSGFSMHYNIDLGSVFKNLHKKLKKDGKIFIVVPHPDDRFNQEIFDKNGRKYIRIHLYGSFPVEYPTHKIEEYFSDFVKNNFVIMRDKTFTYDELGLEYMKSNNAVLYIQLQKK